MNNRTEAKLTDLSGMQKGIEGILQQAWERGRKYGRNEEKPQGEWYDHIPTKCLKARHGEYVLYKVDFLLDNLAREVNIMESARRMKGGEEE